MARSQTDRNRNQSNPDNRIARRTARQIDQQRRQRDADDVKVILGTWVGKRTGTNG
jgi:hypothetical protein